MKSFPVYKGMKYDPELAATFRTYSKEPARVLLPPCLLLLSSMTYPPFFLGGRNY